MSHLAEVRSSEQRTTRLRTSGALLQERADAFAKSFVPAARIWLRSSIAIAASRLPASIECLRQSFVSFSATGELRSIDSAIARAAASSWSSGTTRDTSPVRSARAASMKSPVRSSSDAIDAPTSRGSKYETPTSHAERPRRMKAAFMRALSPAMRTSDASAIAMPPPDAAPRTAAMIGCGARRISMMSSAMWRCPRRLAETPPAATLWPPLASFKVEPRAERATRAADDQHPRLGVVDEIPEEVAQLVHELARQRVQRIGTVSA
jgi:hypothetical protein